MPTTSPANSASARPRTAHGTEYAWLEAQHEGRLGYRSGRGPRTVVVRFAVTGDDIVIRLPEYNDAVGYTSGQQVCLTVDGAPGPDSECTTVEVRGRARRADGEVIAPGAAETLGESWPQGVRLHQILLPLTDVALLPGASPAQPGNPPEHDEAICDASDGALPPAGTAPGCCHRHRRHACIR